ncbi:hypothetical protein H0H93_000835 [Arthromyces matolae]|nr:hypothetical protein H0H93_000835 [Arthromyces matolae]
MSETDTQTTDKPVVRHPVYYFEDGTTIFLVQNTLFKIHRYFLTRESDVFGGMFAVPPPPEGAEGNSDDCPIVLPEVKVSEFEALLDYFYYATLRASSFGARLNSGRIPVAYGVPPPPGTPTHLQEWLDLLSIAHRYGFQDVQRKAVSTIEALGGVNPVARFLLGKKYNLGSWRVSALNDLCQRSEPLVLKETMALELPTYTLLAKARELARQRHFLSCLAAEKAAALRTAASGRPPAFGQPAPSQTLQTTTIFGGSSGQAAGTSQATSAFGGSSVGQAAGTSQATSAFGGSSVGQAAGTSQTTSAFGGSSVGQAAPTSQPASAFGAGSFATFAQTASNSTSQNPPSSFTPTSLFTRTSDSSKEADQTRAIRAVLGSRLAIALSARIVRVSPYHKVCGMKRPSKDLEVAPTLLLDHVQIIFGHRAPCLTAISKDDELIYVPGRWKYKDGTAGYRITRIYVSSKLSTENGRRNWNIPKFVADFNITTSGDETTIKVTHPGQTEPFFFVKTKPVSILSWIPIPMNTRLLGSLYSLVQPPLPRGENPEEVGTTQWATTSPVMNGTTYIQRILPMLDGKVGDGKGFPAIVPWSLGAYGPRMIGEFGLPILADSK